MPDKNHVLDLSTPFSLLEWKNSPHFFLVLLQFVFGSPKVYGRASADPGSKVPAKCKQDTRHLQTVHTLLCLSGEVITYYYCPGTKTSFSSRGIVSFSSF